VGQGEAALDAEVLEARALCAEDRREGVVVEPVDVDEGEADKAPAEQREDLWVGGGASGGGVERSSKWESERGAYQHNTKVSGTKSWGWMMQSQRALRRRQLAHSAGHLHTARATCNHSGRCAGGHLHTARATCNHSGQSTTYIAAVHAGSAPFDHKLGAGIGRDGLEEDGADSTAGEQLVDVAKEREDGVVQESKREMVESGWSRCSRGSEREMVEGILLRWSRCSRGGAAPPRGGHCDFGHVLLLMNGTH
jgi:hypothetical protein